MLLNCPYNTLFYCKTTDDSSQGNDSTSLLQYYNSSRNASKRSVPYVISVMIPPPSHSIFTVMPQNWTPAFLPDFALQYACCSYCKTDRAYFSTCMAVFYISYNMQLLLPGTFCYAFMNAIISYFIISNCCSFSAYMPPSLSPFNQIGVELRSEADCEYPLDLNQVRPHPLLISFRNRIRRLT